MRVMHLLHASGPEASPTALAALADAAAVMSDPRIVLIGGAGPRAQAADAGVEPDGAFGAPCGWALAGYPALTRWLDGFEPIDLMHAWSPGAALLGSLGRPRTRQVATLASPARGVRRAMPVLAASEALARHFRRRGARRVRKLPPAADVSARIGAHPRSEVRARWGVSEETRVVALLSDPPTAGDARFASLVASLANEASGADGGSPPIRLLVHPRQHGLAAAARTQADLGRPPLTIADPALRSPWRVLAGCDAAICVRPDAGGALLQWPLGAGVPVLAEAGGAVAKRLEALQHGVSGNAQRLAHALQRLHERGGLTETARPLSPADAGFDLGAHHVALQDAYASFAAPPSG